MAEDIEVNRHRGGGSLGVAAVVIFRLNQFGIRGRGLLSAVLSVLSLPLVAFARLLLSCELPGSVACGRRLVLGHGGRGVIVVRDAVLGDDVVMAPFTGLGVAYPAPGAPVVGSRVYLGAFASVLGDVHVGDGAFLGAKSLVTRDVPEGTLVVGVPAKVVGPAPVQP
ncbi:serine O-acetyltransferase [Klenkia sp. PcliD-1-E]|uniref:serine O-acetyltransferase n=1 Tax=Klenkia sp. PcliD-1-E TaxID=2954492 RepID=UPI002096D47A|nr:hypothetical protein [Klenkia sp. PcliD-1-E]MCO7221268.1 hypothetical protein [Klenkia sp. PcliD-1-E]